MLGSGDEEIAEMAVLNINITIKKIIRKLEKTTYEFVGGRTFKFPELCT